MNARTPAPIPQAAAGSAEALAARYAEVRATTLALAAPLSAEDSQVQSMPDASPTKWHLAHTTWFFETFLLEAFRPGHRPFEPAYRMLFNSYYNAVGDKHPRPRRGLLTRPTLEEVHAYRRHVDAAMQEAIAGLAARDERFAALVVLGLHHEQQHQELILMDAKHLLSCNPLRPAYREPAGTAAAGGTPPPAGWLRFAGGIVSVGHDGEGFAFDNEGPRHETLLRPFELADRLVSQGEYRDFIEDGGYRRPELWLSLGWDAVQSQGWEAPLYWEREASGWSVFGLAGPGPLADDAPVAHLSYFEADAYARWADARLPTEAEWERAARAAGVDADPANLLERGAWGPLPAAAGDPGPRQMIGDLWEWTASAYSPYPGFRPPAGAVGEYNGKFMCNQYVLRGGSFATPASHIRPTYRNFFPPEARWQFSGLRLARDAA